MIIFQKKTRPHRSFLKLPSRSYVNELNICRRHHIVKLEPDSQHCVSDSLPFRWTTTATWWPPWSTVPGWAMKVAAYESGWRASATLFTGRGQPLPARAWQCTWGRTFLGTRAKRALSSTRFAEKALDRLCPEGCLLESDIIILSDLRTKFTTEGHHDN